MLETKLKFSVISNCNCNVKNLLSNQLLQSKIIYSKDQSLYYLNMI